MSTSSDGTRGFDGQRFEQPLPPRSPTRYDLVLALIPAVFALTLTAVALTDLTLRTALTGASLIGSLAVVDALFLNPPTRGGRDGA
ncbi:hypothetical protein ACOZ4I_11685 [Haloarcula salina]|uniref:hypothetical protein n=1 Tax=Haloarcula salina TaxID=1429914 RepID=UPI003C6F4351